MSESATSFNTVLVVNLYVMTVCIGRDPNQVADELEAEIASGKFDLPQEQQVLNHNVLKEVVVLQG